MAAGLAAAADHVQNRWALYALAVSVLAALVAWKVFHVSLLQPLEEKAHQQAQYRLTQEQNRFKDIILRQQLAFGKSLLDIGAYEAAREEYAEAVKLAPASIDAQLGLHKAKIFSRNSKEFNPAVIERRINMVLDIAKERSGGDDAAEMMPMPGPPWGIFINRQIPKKQRNNTGPPSNWMTRWPRPILAWG